MWNHSISFRTDRQRLGTAGISASMLVIPAQISACELSAWTIGTLTRKIWTIGKDGLRARARGSNHGTSCSRYPNGTTGPWLPRQNVAGTLTAKNSTDYFFPPSETPAWGQASHAWQYNISYTTSLDQFSPPKLSCVVGLGDRRLPPKLSCVADLGDRRLLRRQSC